MSEADAGLGVDDDGNEKSGIISASISETDNAEKTVFCPGDTAYINVFRYPFDTVTAAASIGNLTLVKSRIPVEFTDEISFSNSGSGSLSQVPYGSAAATWQGFDTAAISINGKEVTLNKAVLKRAYGYIYCVV